MCVCVQLCSSNAFIVSMHNSQTQKPFFFEYLHGMDLISLKDSNFQGNYRDLVITIATQ